VSVGHAAGLVARDIVLCGVCGSRLYAAARGPKRPRQYHCQKAHGGCGRVSVAAHAIDEYIVGVLLERAGQANLSLVWAERHAMETHRLVAEVARDEQLLNDLAPRTSALVGCRGPRGSRLQATSTNT
jgi:hypothetical protein